MLTNDDIKKLTTLLATKEDVKLLEERVFNKIDEVDKKLSRKIDEVDKKADVILRYADAIEEATDDLDKRLKKVEAVPAIAHLINK